MEYINSITRADLAVCENAKTFLQSSMWGEFKSRFGWAAKAFLVNWFINDTEINAPLLVLEKKLIRGFSFSYIPWGPQLDESFAKGQKEKAAAQLADKIKPFLAHNTIFLRFDFPWFYTEENLGGESDAQTESCLLPASGFKKAAASVQPPDTVIVNLDFSLEHILARMKPKWRYNISLAGKKGVHVKTGSIKEIEVFYSLLKETAARDGILIHNIDYYKTLFEICADTHGQNNEVIRLYIASHESDTLASIVVLFHGEYATYLYGASSNVKRNLMASYALQWKAMQDAKEAGCLYYDLFGIPPNDDPKHPMEGLYRFKTGFGGNIIHRPGSWDYPYKKLIYKLFNIAERLRKKIFNLRKTSRHGTKAQGIG